MVEPPSKFANLLIPPEEQVRFVRLEWTESRIGAPGRHWR